MKEMRPFWNYGFFLVVFLLFGAWCLLAPTKNAYAANVAPTGLNSTATSTTGLTLNWIWGGGTGTSTAVYLSTNGTTYTLASSSIATSTLSLATSSLSINTLYYFKVESTDGGDSSPATSTAFLVYTLANAASTPTASTPTSTTAIPITINANSNPAATEFAILNSTTGAYLNATGATSVSPVWQATSSWSGISATGLSVNTAYQFAVIARNGNNVNAATSTASTAKYTLANVPSNVLTQTSESNKVTITWSGDATDYYVENTTNNTNSSWIALTTQTFSSLNCATTYSFRVKGRNGDQSPTAFATTVSQTTGACLFAVAPSSGPAPTIPSGDTTQNGAVIINGGANETNSVEVMVTLNSTNAFQVALSNSTDFSQASFVPHTRTLPWRLTSGNGLKTVYVMFRSVAGATVMASDSIILTNSSVLVPVPLPVVEAPTPTLITETDDSKVVFANIIKTNYQQGENLRFSYQYKNEGLISAKVNITRQLLDNQGKVRKFSTASKTIKAGDTYIYNVNESLASNLPVGDYTVKVMFAIGQQTEANSFQINVKKMKNKYFVLSQALPAANDFSFDQGAWNKIKSNVALPITLKLTYSYTNNTGVKKTVKILRQLVDQNEQVISTQNGKWQMTAGQKTSYTFTQTLPKILADNSYTIRFRAYDWTTNELLAENNNLSFIIEER